LPGYLLRRRRVTIDKKTFNAYRQTKNPALTTLLATNVKRMRSKASDGNYVRIELEPGTHACPMLEDSLRSVQKSMNESYLSNTCASYPRYPRNFGGQHEQALTLSCPEAARQALLHADAFDFVESEIMVRPATISEVKPRSSLFAAVIA
jgi:lysine-N-methylase